MRAPDSSCSPLRGGWIREFGCPQLFYSHGHFIPYRHPQHPISRYARMEHRFPVALQGVQDRHPARPCRARRARNIQNQVPWPGLFPRTGGLPLCPAVAARAARLMRCDRPFHGFPVGRSQRQCLFAVAHRYFPSAATHSHPRGHNVALVRLDEMR